MEPRWDPLWVKLCFGHNVSMPNIERNLVQMSRTSSQSPPPCWEVGNPNHARALPPHYLMDPPHLHSGLFTDPHYFQSPSLVKSNLATYYRSDKTALGSAGPDEGPGSFSNSFPPSCRLPSLWAKLLSEQADPSPN